MLVMRVVWKCGNESQPGLQILEKLAIYIYIYVCVCVGG